MTTEDKADKALARVRAARAGYEEMQDDVHRARERYYDAVRALNATGMSLRDVAEALGLSHQRVHQMVSEAEGERRRSAKLRKAARAGGVTLLVFVALVSAWTLRDPPSSTPAPVRVASATPAETPARGIRTIARSLVECARRDDCGYTVRHVIQAEAAARGAVGAPRITISVSPRSGRVRWKR